MKQIRPRVSEENYERLEKYHGKKFDDRLGSLLLLKAHSDANANEWREMYFFVKSRLYFVMLFSISLVGGLLAYLWWWFA